MASNSNTWFVDDPIRLKWGETFSSLVIYKNVDEDSEWNAQYCDTDAEKDGVLNLAIGRTRIEVFDDKGKITFILMPVKVKYEKEIYKPGKVELELQITGGDRKLYASQLRQMFLQKETNLNLVTWEDDGEGKYISVAKNFYMYTMHLSHSAGNTTVVTFTCYSPDHKMTLDKYCQAYTNKRLGTDIIKEGINNFIGAGDIDVDIKNFMFTGYDKNTLSVSALADDSTADANGRDELLQSYLLQYNESFYDFICRVANECGEFLYFEDGALHLGLPEQARGALVENPTGLPLLSPYNVTYPEVTADVNTGIKTKPYFYDSVTSSTGNPASGTKLQCPPNSDSITTYGSDLVEPKITMFKDAHFLVALFSAFAKSTSVGDVLVSVAANIVRQFIIYKSKYPPGARKRKENAYLELKKNIEDGNHPIPKNPVSYMDDLTTVFRNSINKCENMAGSQKVQMDFDDTMPDAKLASAVTLGDGLSKAYIVTKMQGEFTLDYQNHNIEALPRLENPQSHLDRNSGTNAALFVPPVGLSQPTYGSAPMRAIVMDAKDPFRLGRVRVIFEWQKGDPGQKDVWSAWIPVSTPFAGKKNNGGGFFMMPEVGSEVIVDFLNNDKTTPYVVGSLYSQDNQGAPGYEFEYDGTQALSKAFDPSVHVQTIQSSCGHGITFFDSPDMRFFEDVAIPIVGQGMNSDKYRKKRKNSQKENEQAAKEKQERQEEKAQYEKDLKAKLEDWKKDSSWERKTPEEKLAEKKKWMEEWKKKWEEKKKKEREESEKKEEQRELDEEKKKWKGLSEDEQKKKEEEWRRNRAEKKKKQEEARKKANEYGDNTWDICKGGGMVLSDTSGFYNITMNADKRFIDISCPLGTVSLNAFTGITISAPNGNVNITGKNVKISAGNNLTLESGTNIKPDSKGATFGKDITKGFVSQAISSFGGDWIAYMAEKTGINISKFMDFSFLRALWETIMRPVEGTMSLTTQRNMTLTAGKGKTVIPAYLQSNVKIGLPFWRKAYSERLIDAMTKDEMATMIQALRTAKLVINQFYSQEFLKWNRLQNNVMTLHKMVTNNISTVKKLEKGSKGVLLKGESAQLPTDILKNIFKAKKTDKFGSFEAGSGYSADDVTAWRGIKVMYESIVVDFGEYSQQSVMNALISKVNAAIQRNKFKNEELKLKEEDFKNVKPIPDGVISGELLFGENAKNTLKEGDYTDGEKKIVRLALYALLKMSKNFKSDKEKIDETKITDDGEWNKYVKNLVVKKPNGFVDAFKQGLSGAVGGLLKYGDAVTMFNVDSDVANALNANGKIGPYAVSDVSSGGSILMSSNSDYTYRMTDDGTGFQKIQNMNIKAIKAIIK